MKFTPRNDAHNSVQCLEIFLPPFFLSFSPLPYFLFDALRVSGGFLL